MTEHSTPIASTNPFELFDVLWAVGFAMALLWAAPFAILWLDSFVASALGTLIIATIAYWVTTRLDPTRRCSATILTFSFGLATVSFVFTLLMRQGIEFRFAAIVAYIVATLAMVAWYRRFRVPASALLIGLLTLGMLYAVIPDTFWSRDTPDVWVVIFIDIFAHPTANTLFALAAIATGLLLQTRTPDPTHRATAFWCYVLATPLLLIIPLERLFFSDGTQGMGQVVLALALITLVALITNRPSVLALAIVCTGTAFLMIVEYHFNATLRVVNLALLAAFATAMAIWWHPLRATLLRALPDFPGKSRLPPYGPTE